MIFPNKYIAAGTEYADLEHFVPAPIFRKKFTASGTVKAEIIIGAAGFYKLFINGKNITKGELAPYISNTEDIVYYDRYDVTDLISLSLRCVQALLTVRAALQSLKPTKALRCAHPPYFLTITAAANITTQGLKRTTSIYPIMMTAALKMQFQCPRLRVKKDFARLSPCGFIKN